MAKAPVKKESTEVVDWEAQMAAQAEVAAGAQRSTGSVGKSFSMKAGQLSLDGSAMPGNQMAVVILADIMENSYYPDEYDPDTPMSPRCFAFAKHEDELEPHPAVDENDYFERQHIICNGCQWNEWGSARTGRGKACKNVMRLAMIPAGQYMAKGGRNAGYDLELWDEPEQFAKSEVAYMKLPVTSVKNYAKYVRDMAATMKRPPQGLITNVYLVPDDKSQFKVQFECIEKLDGSLLNVVMPRHIKEQEAIGAPYSPPLEKEEPVKNKASAKLRGGKK